MWEEILPQVSLQQPSESSQEGERERAWRGTAPLKCTAFNVPGPSQHSEWETPAGKECSHRWMWTGLWVLVRLGVCRLAGERPQLCPGHVAGWVPDCTGVNVYEYLQSTQLHHGFELLYVSGNSHQGETSQFKECGKHSLLEIVDTKSYVSDKIIKLFILKRKLQRTAVVNKHTPYVRRSCKAIR